MTRSQKYFATTFVAATVLFTQTTIVSAFTPGKWNPMDHYILRGQAGGPRAVLVHDPDGKILQTAEFQYDANGRLLREVYINSSGQGDGHTLYEYQGDRVTGEKLYNSKSELVERKVYLYTGGRLSAIQVMDNKDQEILQVDYTSKGELIQVAEEKREKNLDRILFVYRADKLDALEVKDEAGNVFSRTKFEYGQAGELTRRERFQGGRRYLCKYVYGANGKIAGYEYSNFNPEQNRWELEKRLTFRY